MWNRSKEALELAREASKNADTAISEIRAHAVFCTERESKRDREHTENLASIRSLTEKVSGMGRWITTLVFTAMGFVILQLLIAVGYLFSRYALKI